MKILVTGDRNWGQSDKREDADADRAAIKGALRAIAESTSEQVTLIHGKARGVDSIAGQVAVCLDWKVVEVPADWARYGHLRPNPAGPIRNNEMLDMEPDFVIAFNDDIKSSKGTRHCLTEALKRGYDCTLVNSAGEEVAIPEDL